MNIARYTQQQGTCTDDDGLGKSLMSCTALCNHFAVRVYAEYAATARMHYVFSLPPSVYLARPVMHMLFAQVK